MPATTLPVFNKDGKTVKFSVGSPYRDILKQKENPVIDEAFELPFVPNGLDLVIQPDWLSARGWFRP